MSETIQRPRMVSGGWECPCVPVPPWPLEYPGPCYRCFSLRPDDRPTTPTPGAHDG